MASQPILINTDNPTQNEFFRIKAIFDEISQNEGTSEAIKLRILADRAIELYKYMQAIPSNIDKILALKYEPGKIAPSENAMTVESAMRQADVAKETYHDYATAKENYRRIIKHYQYFVRQYALYEPFFNNALELIKKLEPRLDELHVLYRKDAELKEILSLVDDLRKSQKTTETVIEQMRKDYNDSALVWETAALNILSQIELQQHKYDVLMAILARPGVLGAQQKDFLPLLGFVIENKRDKISVQEIAQILQEKDVVAALVRQPWFPKAKEGGYYVVDWQLLSDLSKLKKVENKNQLEWLQQIKVEVGNIAGKITRSAV